MYIKGCVEKEKLERSWEQSKIRDCQRKKGDDGNRKLVVALYFYFLLIYFWWDHTSRNLISPPRLKPRPPQEKHWILTTRPWHGAWGSSSWLPPERSYHTPKVRGSGWEELPTLEVRALPGRSYSMPEVKGAVQRNNPTSKERRQPGRRRAKRSYSTFKVRKGSSEKIPLLQGK